MEEKFNELFESWLLIVGMSSLSLPVCAAPGALLRDATAPTI